MPKPLKFPTKVLIGFDDRQLALIDDWRRKQAALPSRSEAIRRLVDQALATPAKAPPSPPAARPAKPVTDSAAPKQSKSEQIATLRRDKAGGK